MGARLLTKARKRNKFFIVSSVFIVFSLIANIVSASERVVDEIVVEGNRRVASDTVLLQITSVAGTPFSAETVRADVKEIYRTGFFEQVTAKIRESKDSMTLVFQVVEKPAIRNVLLQGNDEVDDSTLQEKLNFEARRFLDRQKISAGIRGAELYYQSLGYNDAEIDFIVTPVLDNQVDLTFRVEEGEKVILRTVRFEGNRAFDAGDLEDVVATGGYSWWRSWLTGTGVIKQEQLDNDVRELTRFYLNSGYADIRVSEPEITRVEDGLELTFKIDEGELYVFDSVAVEGDLIDDSVERTLEGISSSPGDVFNVDSLREDSFAISDKFTDIGFAFANVEPNTNINREMRSVRVVFQVDKGEEITVDRINVTGNDKTRDNVIRRTMKLQERDVFSSSKIRRSQELLTRLGYFDEVTITPESATKPDEVDLNVSVREGSTGTFSAGAGVSSGDGFIVNGRISENNLFGYGYSVALNVDLGSRNENFVLSFDNPRVSDTHWSLGFDALSVEREFDDFDRDQKGGSVTAGYPLAFLGPEILDDIRFSLRYEYLKVDIKNVEEGAPTLIQDAEGKSTSSGITPRLVRNTIDNPLNPTKGSRQTFGVEVAGIGGSEEFWLAQASNTLYYPILELPNGTLVFSNRVRIGYGDTFDGEDFPLFRRFFPGGINSVRGYDSRELGPQDEEGDEFGGSKQLVLNFEFIFPMFSSLGLKGLVFYDLGEAFDDDEDIEFSELRQGVGWGFRWNSPLGPIRIEIGYPIDREEGEKSVVTHFSFGAPL